MDIIEYSLARGQLLPSDEATHYRNIPGAADDLLQDQLPIDIRDAMNVMPTSRGYSSFFGVRQVFGVDPLPPHIDELFTVKDELGNNIVIALAETGVYSQNGDLTTPVGTIIGDAFETQDYGY